MVVVKMVDPFVFFLFFLGDCYDLFLFLYINFLNFFFIKKPNPKQFSCSLSLIQNKIKNRR